MSNMPNSVYESGTEEASTRNCFAVLVDNEPGVLARVVGLFSGRGYNIESLTVDEVEHKSHLSRITVVTNGPPMIIEQIKAQLGRLIPVRQVVNLSTQGKFIEGCLAYIKLIGNFDQRDAAKLIARKLGARIVDTTDTTIMFEMTEATHKIEQLINELRPLGKIEVARTGSVAMASGEAVLEIRG
jgi:acetolactate synthase-1/3 small subunit